MLIENVDIDKDLPRLDLTLIKLEAPNNRSRPISCQGFCGDLERGMKGLGGAL